MEYSEISMLLGKVFTKVEVCDELETIIFVVSEDESYRMYHYQDCCEYVSIDEMDGDFNDLVGSPITLAEEAFHEDDSAIDSGTWTFYRLGTIKGTVHIKWYGTSNGYYSESVTVERYN